MPLRSYNRRTDSPVRAEGSTNMTNVIAYVQTLIALKSDRRAVTALEYGMIAALIAAVIVGAVTTLGTTINTMFTTLAGKI